MAKTKTDSYTYKLQNIGTPTFRNNRYSTLITMKDWDDNNTITFTLATATKVVDVGNLSIKVEEPEEE